MLKHYFKIAWRSIAKNKFYSFLHVFGLGLGMTCCLFIFLFTTFHLSFDHYHKHAESTYRVVNELHLETTEYNKGASYTMYKALETEFPAVENAALLISGQQFTVRIGDDLYKEDKNASFASSAWFRLFDYRWVQGNPIQLDEPNTVVLTTSIAKKYFNDKDPMGRILLINSKYPVKVVGILDDSRTNTDLKSGIYLSMASVKTILPDIRDNYFTDWNYLNSTNNLFISLKTNTERLAVEETMMRLAKENMGPDLAKYYTFKLLPLQDIHFDTKYGGVMQKTLLLILIVIGFSIMAVAGINYINMVTAQQARRSIEIGTRKVLGSSRLQLFYQFMTESILLSSFALLFAWAMIWTLLPVSNQTILANEPIQIISFRKFLLVSAGIWALVCLGTGLYPAYFLSKLNIHESLKNSVGIKNAIGRKALIVMQNVVAQILLVAMLIMVLQVQFLQNTDKGFDRESVVLIPLSKKVTSQKNGIGKYLGEDPLIKSYSFCFRSPASERNWGGTFLFDKRAEWESWPARYAIGDSAYIRTFGIELVTGRNFRDNSSNPEFLINEKMVSMLGFKNANEVIGKELLAGGLHDEVSGRIVGVVGDFNTKSLLEAIEPTVIGYNADWQQTLAIKLSGIHTTEALSKLREEWQTLFPDEVFDYEFLDDQIEGLYQKEILQQKLIWIGGGIAVVISSMGLLGLLSIMTLRRTKEIGIRKVLGASVTSIVRLLSADFVKLVLIAIIIALPVAWWIMHQWLEDFPYRIHMEWWMFLLVGTVAIFIALLTVSFQAVKAAVANPVNSLRDE